MLLSHGETWRAHLKSLVFATLTIFDEGNAPRGGLVSIFDQTTWDLW